MAELEHGLASDFAQTDILLDEIVHVETWKNDVVMAAEKPVADLVVSVLRDVLNSIRGLPVLLGQRRDPRPPVVLLPLFRLEKRCQNIGRKIVFLGEFGGRSFLFPVLLGTLEFLGRVGDGPHVLLQASVDVLADRARFSGRIKVGLELANARIQSHRRFWDASRRPRDEFSITEAEEELAPIQLDREFVGPGRVL